MLQGHWTRGRCATPSTGGVRIGLVALALALLLPGSLAGEATPRSAAPAPNVVFLLADDLGWGDLGCYGNREVRTPNLDRLAQEGTLFTQFYVNGSVCSPARAALMTGRFPARDRVHGHFWNTEKDRERAMPDWLDPSLPTVASSLKGAGYATAHFGKWHLSTHTVDYPTPDRYGFDVWGIAHRWDDEGSLWHPKRRPSSSAAIADATIEFLRAAHEGPFYVQSWFIDVHSTLDPSDEQMKPYARFQPGSRHASSKQVYYACVTELDRQVGRIVDVLDELGLGANTLVIFASDNGPESPAIRTVGHSAAGSAGPFRGVKRSLYEGGVRVPLLVRWPGVTPAGRVDDASIVSGVDLLPTLASLADVACPTGIDGVNVAAALRGRPFERLRPLFWEWRFPVVGHPVHQSPMLAVRNGRWKLLMNPDRSRIELYDLELDLYELDDRAAVEPKVVERLSRELLSWQAGLPEGPRDPRAGQRDLIVPVDDR